MTLSTLAGSRSAGPRPSWPVRSFLAGALLAAVGCTGPEDPVGSLPPLPPRVVAPGPGEPAPARPFVGFTVAVTGEVRGEIEPCGCPTVPYGGFPRRVRALEALRAEDEPVFVLDAGLMLVKGDRGHPAPDRLERARAVLDLARGTGLDAWAPGPVDLAPAGLRLLAGSRALSANWRQADGGAPLPAATVVERGGVRLGVVGLSGPLGAGEGDLTVAEPVGAVRAAMEGLTADAWVVLSNASDTVNVEVAEQVAGVGVVFGTRGGSLDAPRVTAGAPVVETPDRGRFLTVARAYVGAAPGPMALADSGVWKRWSDEARRVAALDPGPQRDAAAQGLTALRAEVAAAARGYNRLYVEDRPLGGDLDGDTPLDARIRTFKGAAVRAAQARVDAEPEVAAYSTAGACSGCHTRHFAQWVGDPHRRAYDALISRAKGLDVECVACHSTGFGEPGGFAEISPATLANTKAVQCEACHGPLAGHPRDDRVKPRPITPETCTGCHDAANSPSFDFGTYVARVSCSVLAREDRR